MKTFDFPFDRVLAWRRTQARIEQTKLEKLQRDLRNLDSQAQALIEEEHGARQLVIRSATTGAELSALESFHASCIVRAKSLDKARADQETRIRQQQQIIALKERDVKLLEKLREQKLADWRHENSKETDSQAEEAYLARWSKR